MGGPAVGLHCFSPAAPMDAHGGPREEKKGKVVEWETEQQYVYAIGFVGQR